MEVLHRLPNRFYRIGMQRLARSNQNSNCQLPTTATSFDLLFANFSDGQKTNFLDDLLTDGNIAWNWRLANEFGVPQGVHFAGHDEVEYSINSFDNNDLL
jgi:hypothetical protein